MLQNQKYKLKKNVVNPDGSIEHPVTLEEVLDEARGNGILFIELKAPTADEVKQWVDRAQQATTQE